MYNTSNMDEKNVNAANRALKKVLEEKVSFSEEERKNVMENGIETLIKGRLVPKMKSIDPLFRILYRDIAHMGSYYEKVRIGDPYEFDLNLVLDLKIPDRWYEIRTTGSKPGYATITVLENPCDRRVFSINHPLYDYKAQFKEKLFVQTRSNSGWLGEYAHWLVDADKVRNWIRGIIHRAVNALNDDIRMLTSGPAITLSIWNDQVSIDLVPTFDFKLDKITDSVESVAAIARTGSHREVFYCVPKPHEDPVQWRLSFPSQEKFFLTGPRCIAKTVVRLLKAFRESNQDLSGLSSYCLKTVVLLMRRDSMRNSKWQSEKNLATLFIEALDKLRNCLANRRVPHVFMDEVNLLPERWIEDPFGVALLNKHNWIERKISLLRKTLQSSYDKDDCRRVWLSIFGNFKPQIQLESTQHPFMTLYGDEDEPQENEASSYNWSCLIQ